MKRFPLVLAVVLFAAACTDATAPATHSLSVPTPPNLVLQGNLPPPPADATIDVSISGTSTVAAGAYLATVSSDPLAPLRGEFTGAYFANGASVDAAAASIELGDASLSFLGTAWLRFDNNQLGNASANARFQRSDDKLFGTGTLVIVQVEDGVPVSHTIKIVAVTSFTNLDCSLFECVPNPDCSSLFGDQCVPNPDCSFSREQCAVIVFDATVDGVSGYQGTATASNAEPCRLECDVVAPPPG